MLFDFIILAQIHGKQLINRLKYCMDINIIGEREMNTEKDNSSMTRKQLEHRTIREFKEQAIPENVFEELIEVARRTATSTGMQASSIIRITDPVLRKEIADICTQEYVARAPELLIFIVDQRRNYQILKEKDGDLNNIRGMDNFFASYTDACLMAQNIVNAAESLDFGTVYLGSILNDPSKMCELLDLPELTFPVIGLGIGYPKQEPQIKPRMDMGLRVFENSYKVFDNYLEVLKDYDEEMQTYYDLRDANRRVDCFSDQVVTRYTTSSLKRQEVMNSIRDQGFDLKLNEFVGLDKTF